jgi:hypothetical protein
MEKPMVRWLADGVDEDEETARREILAFQFGAESVLLRAIPRAAFQGLQDGGARSDAKRFQVEPV